MSGMRLEKGLILALVVLFSVSFIQSARATINTITNGDTPVSFVYIATSNVTPTDSGVSTSVGVNIHTVGGSARVAIYSMNASGGLLNLLGESASVALTSTDWNDISLPGVQINASTQIWLAVQLSNVGAEAHYDSGMATDTFWKAQAYGAFPDPPVSFAGGNPKFALRLTYDSTPRWSNNQSDIKEFSGYSANFNITWTSGNGTAVNASFFESNYSGTATNYTMTRFPDFVMNYNTTMYGGSYYWKSYANNSTNGWNETSVWNFTISNFTQNITSCGDLTSYSVRLVPRTEEVPFTNVNGTMKVYLYFYNMYGNKWESNFSVSNTSYWICMYPNTTNITMYGQIQYQGNESGEYAPRNYFLDAEVFDNTSRDLNLYLLPTVNGTLITFNLKDQYNNPYSDAVIKIQRYYPEYNFYKTIDAPKTDSNGNTLSYLIPYTTYYRQVVQQNGIVLHVVPASLLTSSSINVIISPTQTVDYLRYYKLLNGTVTYDEATGNVTAIYYDLSGYSTGVTLKVYRVGALERIEMCNIENTSSSGKIVCHIGNATADSIYEWQLMADIISPGVGASIKFLLDHGILNTGAYASILFGSCRDINNIAGCREGLIITFLVVLTATLIGISSSPMGILTTLVGLAVTYMVGLYAISLPMLIGLICVGAILIWKVRIRE